MAVDFSLPLLQSLRYRLAGVLAVVLLPVALIGVAQGTVALTRVDAEIQQTFIERAELLAEDVRDDVIDMFGALAALDTVNEGLRVRLPICSQSVFEELAELYSLRGLSLLTVQGEMICSLGERIDIAEFGAAGWNERALEGRYFAAMARDPAGDAEPNLIIAARDAADQGTGRSILLSLPARAFKSTLMPRKGDQALIVANRFRNASGEENVSFAASTSLAPAVTEQIIDRLQDTDMDSGFMGPDIGDSEAFYVLKPVLGDSLHILLSRPALSALSGDALLIWLQIIVPAGLWLIAIACALLATDRLILRWLRVQRLMVAQYARGDWREKPRPVGVPLEFEETFKQFDRMARRIDMREAELKDAIAQKDLSIKEIHHRVKNNLQIITSLLNLQARKAQDEGERELLGDLQTRIGALAAIHGSLYEAEDLQQVELGAFIAQMADHFVDLATTEGGDVKINADVPTMLLSSDRAIPLALLIAEAVTNSLQHAFADEKNGEIRISVAEHAAGDGVLYDVEIADNGKNSAVAQAEGSALGRPGLGRTLMTAFARQLGGRIGFEHTDRGTTVLLTGARLT